MASPQPAEDSVTVEQPATTASAPASNDNAPQPLPKDQLAILSKVLEDLQKHVDDQDHEICNDFLRVINKRYLPEYYDVIKEVMAFSTIKAKILKKQYTSFKQFVRDLALISHNAQVYNRPSAPVYKDALALRAAVKEELQKLVDNGTVTAEEAELPDLGEIPPVDPSPPPGPDDEEEEEEEEEDEEDEDEDDDSDDDNPKKRGKKKGRRTSGGNKREKGDDDAGASSSKRMRPPKVLTPMEARINNLLKALRKYKNPDGDLKILNFEKLPDKATYPEYYQEIKNPIAMDMIKKKAKRKNYHSVEHVLKDLELMFSNAMEYNQDNSQIYKDAKDLLQEARDIAEFEKKKPDSDFVDEDGKLPLPEILYNGEIWKVGDWVHIENANDAVKPIVAQIYRTWRDGDGQNWVNACWYYRPEQTVHQYQKHFLENEVVKTGRYCDHKIDDVKERCFVMFVTRYFRGRPRGFPADKQVYVCEARYNEEKFEMNKIKTWASCIPDEVRDKDYEMVLFDTPRPNKKVESPIKHLLREDAKEDDPLPKPTWGAPNCPPIVGAVHRRPPPKNQSPPPEPTPPPQQQPAPEPIRQAIMSDRQRFDSQGDAIMSRSSFSNPTPPPMPSHGAGPTQYGHQFASSRPSISPAPMAHQNSYGSHGSGSQSALPQTPHYQSQSFGQHSAAASTPALQNTNPVSTHDQYQSSANAVQPPAQSASRTSSKYSPPKVYGNNAYNPPRATEVFTLSEQDNNNIPVDIREQFQKDQFGKVLFFTTPPLVTNAATEQDPSFGHSLSYLADKARAKEAEDKKRKAQHDNVGDSIKSAAGEKLRRIKANNPNALKHAVEEQKAQYLRENQEKIMLSWAEQHNEGTNELYKQMYGDQWKEMREQRDRETAIAQTQAIQERKAIEDYHKQVEERKKVPITGFSWI